MELRRGPRFCQCFLSAPAYISLPVTQRETQTWEDELSDFSKFFWGGGWKSVGMRMGVGRGWSQPCGLTERKWKRPGCLLWGRAVIREVTHGPPPFPLLCPSLKFLISFWPGEGFATLGTAKGVSRRCRGQLCCSPYGAWPQFFRC